MNTTEIGQAAEQLVTDTLAARGYAIIGRNMHIGSVEVDILAMNAARLIVVEVKARKAGHFDDNFHIDSDKIRRLCRAGANYVRSMNMPHEVQIDAALITNHHDGTATLEYLDDIALPPRRTHHR